MGWRLNPELLDVVALNVAPVTGHYILPPKCCYVALATVRSPTTDSG